jgi:divalent metal cation (Fe/Co/Zn/Cd) transporter
MSKISSKRAILTSFLVDLGDIALNVTVMIITGSVVLLAEALEGIPSGLGKLSFRGPCFPRS